MLSKLKERFTGTVNKYSGNKDFLEAVCAASALIAAADGEVEDSEVAQIIKSITANPKLSGSFDARQIETTAETMIRRAQSGRAARLGLYAEIGDISKDIEMAETVVGIAYDIAEADGEIEPQEKLVIEKIAQQLKVDLKKFDV